MEGRRLKALHVGCGASPLPHWLAGYEETRLDIDPACEPDIVASMLDLGDIGGFDIVYASHCLEHLAPHEVPRALSEFLRVLNDGGGVVLLVPDLEGVKATEEVLFVSPAGPITGLDLLYGHRASLQERPYMAHRTGFVAETLQAELERAGFSAVKTERLTCHNLLAAARK